MQRSTKGSVLLIGVLMCMSVLLWWQDSMLETEPHITVVPSGNDAVVIARDTHHTVVVGGGKDGSIVRTLSQSMPWYIHTINVLVLTQLDGAHSGGAIDMIDRYHPARVFESYGVTSGAEWVALQMRFREMSTAHLERGVAISDGVIYVETVFPDRPLSHTDAHTGCASMRITTGLRSVLVVCDTDPRIIPYLVFLDGSAFHVDVLVLPETLFRSTAVRLLLGYGDPSEVVVTHSCTKSLASTTIATVASFGLQIEDLCTNNVRL